MQLPAYGGVWPQPGGSSFLKVKEWWIVSDEHFDPDGNKLLNTHEFGYYSTSLYSEYVITDRITTQFYFPFLNYLYAVPPSGNGKLSAWSVGDAELGLKYGLTKGSRFSLSLQLIAGLPLGKERGSLPGGLQSGDGEWNTALIGHGGSEFRALGSDGWFSIHAGYNYRTEGYADELLYGGEAGISIAEEKLSIVARLTIADAVGKSDKPVNPQSLFSNKREYANLAPEIIYQPSMNWAITAEAGFKLYGRNTFASPSFSVGLVYVWNG